MSDEEDLSAWDDALAEQADSEVGVEEDVWDDALSEQSGAEAAANAESISSAAFDEQETMFITYAYGPLTVGYQTAESDVQGGVTSDADTLAYSASYAVSDDLSVSYGVHEYEYGNTSLVDQESSGFSVSYTMGSMTIAAAANNSDNVGGTSGTDDTHKEMSIAFAF
jgi:hypothetical protein